MQPLTEVVRHEKKKREPHHHWLRALLHKTVHCLHFAQMLHFEVFGWTAGCLKVPGAFLIVRL